MGMLRNKAVQMPANRPHRSMRLRVAILLFCCLAAPQMVLFHLNVTFVKAEKQQTVFSPPPPPQQGFLLACTHNHIPIRSEDKRLTLPWKCSPAARPEVALCGACFTLVFTPYVHSQAGRMSEFYLHTLRIHFDSLKITSGCLPLKDAYDTRRWQTNACCLFFFIYKKSIMSASFQRCLWCWAVFFWSHSKESHHLPLFLTTKKPTQVDALQTYFEFLSAFFSLSQQMSCYFGNFHFGSTWLHSLCKTSSKLTSVSTSHHSSFSMVLQTSTHHSLCLLISSGCVG